MTNPDGALRFGVLSDHALIEDANHVPSGVFIATPAPQAIGSTVDLKLSLPWGEGMDLHGQVAWVISPEEATLRRPAGMAVQCELTDLQRALLERLRVHRPPMA